jgi:hypothetical protein
MRFFLPLGLLLGLPCLATQAQAARGIYLGTEIDQCSGRLEVYDRYEGWMEIRRNDTLYPVWVQLVDGYWTWKCNGTLEWSRGEPNVRHRVDYVRVAHSSGSRQITWRLFDSVD